MTRVSALAALLGLCAAAPAQSGAFPRLELVSRTGYTLMTDKVTKLPVGVKLPGALLGLGEDVPFAFGHSVRRCRVFRVPGTTSLLLLAGGVRSDLSVHVLRGDGLRRSLRFPGGRLIRDLQQPALDADASICAVLLRQAGQVRVRVFDIESLTPRLLLARELAQTPARMGLERLQGSARIVLRIGSVRMRAPGETEYRLPDGAPGFLHPRARVPQPSALHVDFGAIERGTRREKRILLKNPGELALQVVWEPPGDAQWQLRTQPAAMTLPAGAEREVRFELMAGTAADQLESRVPLRDGSRAGDPLLELRVTARAETRTDDAPPVFDTKRIELKLSSAREIEVRGLPGAVQDASPPIEVLGVRGERVRADVDGSFLLRVERGIEGRVVLVGRDAKGKSGVPVFVGRVRDNQAPVLDGTKIRTSLLGNGKLWLIADKGAIEDLTPPLRLELLQGGRRRALRSRPGPGGEFRVRVAARPGEDLTLLVSDSAVPRNRARHPLGRALPFVERRDQELVVQGLPWARFRIASFTGESDGAAPVRLVELEGALDGEGRMRLPVSKLQGGVQLRLEMEQPLTGRFHGNVLPMPPAGR